MIGDLGEVKDGEHPGGKAFDLGLEEWVDGSQEKERYFRQKPQDMLIGEEGPISLGWGADWWD